MYSKKYKNKLIVLDSASSHRNKNVKDVGLEKLKQNIRKLIKEIPKTTYKNFFKEVISEPRTITRIKPEQKLLKYTNRSAF